MKIALRSFIAFFFVMAVASLGTASYAARTGGPLFGGSGGPVFIGVPAPSDKISSFAVILKWGVHDEESHVAGMRAFAAEMIYAKFDELKNSEGVSFFESMGVMAKTETEPDYMIFTFECMTVDFDAVFNRVCSVLSSFYADEGVFKKAKEKYLKKYENRNGVIDDVYSLFISEFYRYHPYRRINDYSLSAIKGLEYEKAASFMKRLFSSERIFISVCGSVDMAKAERTALAHFPPSGIAPSSIAEVQWEPAASKKENFVLSSSRNGFLIFGYPAPSFSSPDYPVMKLIECLSGRGFSSRLWNEVREKKGLAYSVGATYPALEGPSHIMLYAVIAPSSAMKVRKIFADTIANLAKEGPTERELATAKEKVIGEFLLRIEPSAGMASETASSAALGSRFAVDDFEKKIRKVTPEDTVRVMRKYFGKPMVLIVRPPNLYLNDTWM